MRISNRIATGTLLAFCAVCLLTVPTVRAADTDIVITEIMQNPFVLLDAVGEWFEIHNTGSSAVDLQGWTIKDNDTDSHVIPLGTPVIVPAGAYAVLAVDAATMAGQGVTVLYQYATFTLANGADELVLLNAALVEIDRVEYDGGPLWPDPNGASMMWNETGDNNVAANWAASAVAFGGGDFGTPGAANGDVPLQDPVVANVYHRSLLPVPGESATVYADVTDADGTIVDVSLYYQVNGGGIQIVSMSLSSGDTYTGVIPGAANGDLVEYFVEATDNDGLFGSNPATGFYGYTVAPETFTSIATVHADSLAYDGQVIMIQAQVYIPGDHKADGVSVSAWVQDASNRGLNIFGTTRSTGMADLNSTGNIVKISGTVDWYFDTVELVNYQVELVSTGNPVLVPATQTTAAAAAPTNEGTYVRAVGPVTAITTTGGTNPAHNFTIDDGSGPVVVRVDDDINIDMPTWLVGDELEAAGAGGTYAAQGQIIVGLASDLINNGQGPDLTPPTLASAVLGAPTVVMVQFSESVNPATAANVANYSVYETATPGNTTAVTLAVVQLDDSFVQLTLAGAIDGVAHTLAVSNVQDLAGNPIVSPSTIAIYEAGPTADIVINEIMQNPFALFDAAGEWFEVYNAGATAVDMNGWTISDLGLDSHVIDNGGPLVINPGEYKVFAVDAAAMLLEGVTVFYQYAGVLLSNSDDELILTDTEARQVDYVGWDNGLTFPDPDGASMQYDGSGDNALGENWAVGGPIFGSGDRGTPGAVNDVTVAVPSAADVTALRGNHPNPFNPRTTFSFNLARDAQVKLAVYDMRGHMVRTLVNERLAAGEYVDVFAWDGRDEAGRAVTSGTYFYRLSTADGFTESRKMMLLK